MLSGDDPLHDKPRTRSSSFHVPAFRFVSLDARPRVAPKWAQHTSPGEARPAKPQAPPWVGRRTKVALKGRNNVHRDDSMPSIAGELSL